jgi:hypothetical protein
VRRQKGYVILLPTVKGTALMILLLAVLALTLGSCGNGGGGGTTSAKTSGGGTTSAATAGRTVELTPLKGSGANGTATFTDTQDGVEVTLDMAGFGAWPYSYPARIYEGGTCSDQSAGEGAPVKYVLSPVTSKEGGKGTSSTTIVGVTTAQLFSDTPKYIAVHERFEGQGTIPESTREGLPPAISCANLPSTSSG